MDNTAIQGRWQIIKELGKNRETHSKISELINDRNPSIRRRVVKTLCTNEDYKSLLLNALNDKHAGVRSDVVRYLGKHEENIDKIKLMLEDEHYSVRAAAVITLSAFFPKTKDVLLKMLKDPNHIVREQTVLSLLPRLHDELRKILDHESIDDLCKVLPLFFCDFDIKSLLKEIKTSNDSDYIESKLNHENWIVRKYVAERLSSADLLAVLLIDPEYMVRIAAINSIKVSPEGRQAIASMPLDPEPYVRVAQVLALGEDSKYLELLAKWIDDEAWQVREAIVEMLGRHDKYVNLILEKAEDLNIFVKCAAISVIRRDFVSKGNMLKLLGQKDYNSFIESILSKYDQIDKME